MNWDKQTFSKINQTDIVISWLLLYDKKFNKIDLVIYVIKMYLLCWPNIILELPN